MAVEGYIDYQRREYCKVIHCPVQVLLDQQQENSDAFNLLRSICKSDCLHTTHEFHQWLIQNGFEVVRKAR
jgi:hypothetical protein